jgi:hypothetical protein
VTLDRDSYNINVKALPSPRCLRWIKEIALGVANLVAVIGIIRRQDQHAGVTQVCEAAAIATVSVVVPERGASGLQLVLPGDIQGWYDAPICARVSGYLSPLQR